MSKPKVPEKITLEDAELVLGDGTRIVGFKDRANMKKFIDQVGSILDYLSEKEAEDRKEEK